MNRYALCFITNTLYSDGVCVGMYSFLKNNNWFDGDIVIIDYGFISEEARKKLASVYDKVYFKPAVDPRYSGLIEKTEDLQKKDMSRSVYAFPYIYKIEAFGLEGYDRVVFFDSDLLVFGDVRYLFENDYDFAVVRDLCEDNYTMGETWRKKGDLINSGVMSIKNPSKEMFDEVMEEALNFERDDIYFGYCYEQDSICKFFDKKNVRLLSFTYNFPQVLFIYDNKMRVTDQKIIHYYGPFKPWKQDDPRADYINSYYRYTLDEMNKFINHKTVDVFYAATDVYATYFQDFLGSINNFLPGFKKNVHVISNRLSEYNGYKDGDVSVDIIYQTSLPYPLVSLVKTSYIEEHITNAMRYVFYFDADTRFIEKSPSYWEWFVQCLDTGSMLMARHPKNFMHTYEIDKKSCAYFEKNEDSIPVIGSMYGGERETIREFCRKMNDHIKRDLNSHDENSQNHYIPSLFDQDYVTKMVNEGGDIKYIVRYFSFVPWFFDEHDSESERFVEQKWDIARKFEKKNMV